MLTGGHVADCTAGAQLLEKLSVCEILHGPKGYDSDAIGRQVEERRSYAEHPAQGQSQMEELLLYRNRNAIERMFRRLKDFRRVAIAMTETP